MRNFKKFLTLVLAVMMVVSAMSFTTSAAVTNFEDVDADNETLVKAVDLLEYMGITKGVSATEFGADQAVTREQFALFMYRLMKGGKDAPSKASNSTSFTDLEDQTYFYAISWANAKGIIQGTSDTTFAPKNEITLQDAYTMVVRALEYESEEELIYPHGYIDVAEQDGVELDAGLPSDLDYEDALTRGDMAIILYNAFFAETAIPEVKLEVEDEDDDDGVLYYKEVTSYPILCEKYFGVEKVEYQAIATPHYSMDGEEPTYDLGYDAIYFEKVEGDKNVPEYYYLEPEEIGLEADELDDAFLGVFTMFVTVDDEDEGSEIEKVLFADCNMVKKTVSDLKLGTVSSNKQESYFAGSDAKLLSGKITAGDEVIYAFNAPYTYIEPTYAAKASEQEKYDDRNENDIATINFSVDNEDDVDLYTATIEELIAQPTDLDQATADKYFTAQAAELLGKFTEVYYEGLYEADIYDVDGDGVYEYIDYKPYMFFKVNTDEDYDFSSDTDFDAYDFETDFVYTNGAKLEGVEFADEDYVIGYFDEFEKVVKVAAVVKPTVTSIAKIKKNTGSVILADDTPVNVGSAWQLLANLNNVGLVYEDSFNDVVVGLAENHELLDGKYLDKELEFYIYDGVLLHHDPIDDDLKFTENLLIPLDVEGNYPEREFNKDTGDRVWYIYAWVDGERKYIPVEHKDTKPALFAEDASDVTRGEFGNAYLDTNEDEDGVQLSENVTYLSDKYAFQLCTYSVDADGIYSLVSLAYDLADEGYELADLPDDADVNDYEEIDGKYYEKLNIEKDDVTVLNDEDDEDIQFIVTDETGVALDKKAGSRFALKGSTLAAAKKDVVVKSYTKIIVLNYDTDDDEYTFDTLTAADFDDDMNGTFKTVTYLVSNNPESEAKENLVLLFATVEDGLEFTGKTDKKGQRIVALSTTGIDENGYYRNYYDIYNPFTGAKESDVAGNDPKSTKGQLPTAIANGTIVELTNGLVKEKNADNLGKFDPTDDANKLFWISEYDSADEFIVAVAANDGDINTHCKDEFVKSIEGNGNAVFYDITEETSIVVLKNSSVDSLVKWGNMTLGDESILADAKKDYKCYSNDVPDSNKNLTTKQLPYLKAYLETSADEDNDGRDDVDYMIILVHEISNVDLFRSHKAVEDDSTVQA